MTVEIAPVHLELHDVKGESAEGALSCYDPRVEFAFGEFQSDGMRSQRANGLNLQTSRRRGRSNVP